MQKALEIGPDSVTKGAFVVRRVPDGSVQLLREGTNFLSQSAICCMVATKVGHDPSNFGPGNGEPIPHEAKRGFTCLIIRTDRWCADKNSMEFLHAIRGHKPPTDRIGVIYMLAGDTGPNGEVGGASNIDPYEKAKTPTNHWIITGPHIMLLGQPAERWDILLGTRIPIPPCHT